MDIILLIGLFMASYLLGSVNFGIILSASRKVDIKSEGSGNSGATNMLRTFGAKIGLLTLLLDLLKGVIPALVGYFAFGGSADLSSSYIGLYVCGLASVIGHIFPIYYKFKGGKAAATSCGVFLVAQPVVALIAFVLCVGLAMVTKYVSPMSLLFVLINVVWQCLFLPEFVFLENFNFIVMILAIIMGLLVFLAHRENIARLLCGKEKKTDVFGLLVSKLKKK